MQAAIQSGPYKLSGLGAINVLLGKNGVGKSSLLRSFDVSLRVDEDAHRQNVLYVTPERGGEVQENHSIRDQISRKPMSIRDQVRRNYSSSYRTVSVAKFASLMEKVRESFESDTLAGKPAVKSTRDVLAEINALQHRVDVKTDGARPAFFVRDTGAPVTELELSSGEKELFCIAVDLLFFEYSARDPESAVALVDEPDVHVHPDMQSRLGALIASIAKRKGIQFILATHSTAFISGMAHLADIRVAFMRRHQQELAFKSLDARLRQLVPVFGAHPLSNLFNERPLLLVEGDDDEWMWQQAVRSSNRRIWVNPVSVGGKAHLTAYELEANEVLVSLYDAPRAFSLRDGDGISEPLQPSGAVTRLRLSARDPENLLISDEVLADHSFSWCQFQEAVGKWLCRTPRHRDADTLALIAQEGFDRIQGDVKDVRVILAAILGTNAPVPALLGKAVAKHCAGQFGVPSETSIKGMIGEKAYGALFCNEPEC